MPRGRGVTGCRVGWASARSGETAILGDPTAHFGYDAMESDERGRENPMKSIQYLVLAAGLILLKSVAWAHDSSDYSEVRILGDTSGNHDLSCTIIRPWGLDGAPDPALAPYPVGGWLNG